MGMLPDICRGIWTPMKTCFGVGKRNSSGIRMRLSRCGLICPVNFEKLGLVGVFVTGSKPNILGKDWVRARLFF